MFTLREVRLRGEYVDEIVNKIAMAIRDYKRYCKEQDVAGDDADKLDIWSDKLNRFSDMLIDLTARLDFHNCKIREALRSNADEDCIDDPKDTIDFNAEWGSSLRSIQTDFYND